jgi:NAD(P)-dependent dehydrogenase (short-subunit alcohol dehydrogenase family)
MSNRAHELFDRLFALHGLTAVVTGASAGIGKGIAHSLALAGARVVVAARNMASAQEVVAEILAAGGDALALPVEITDEASIIRLMEQANAELGRIDILVNNAGVFPPGAILTTSATQWEELYRVNVTGSFVCLREATKWMKHAGRGGRIINISSNASIRSSVPDRAAYNSSKAAINRLTQDAALEFAADGIRVNAVLPGPIATEKLDALGDAGRQLHEQVAKRVPLNCWGAPQDIAAAVIFLSGASGAYITGQTLVVDGGAVIG